MSSRRYTACTRMYNATPSVEARWTALLEETARLAGLELDIIPHRFPSDIATLWERPNLALVFICGRAFALAGMRHKPLAVPLRSGPGYADAPLYHTDFLTRADSPFSSLQEASGCRLGWTVNHSHSGYIAPFDHIAASCGAPVPSLFRQHGPLHTPAACLTALKREEADIIPLDAYYRSLLEKNAPEMLEGTHVLASTKPYPMPFLAASPDVEDSRCEIIAQALLAAAASPVMAETLNGLCVSGFARPRAADYASLRNTARGTLPGTALREYRATDTLNHEVAS